MPILVDERTKVLVQGITGREAAMVVEHSIAYGTRIVAGVTPGKGGDTVCGVPVYDTVREAVAQHEVNTALVYVPPSAAYDAVMEAISNGIQLIAVPTERVPRHDAVRFLHAGREAGCTILGPNITGVISPRHRAKLGAIGGDDPERCFAPGSVGVVSRSGGMTAECAWMLKRVGLGVSTAVSVGGDPLLGISPAEVVVLFQADPETDAVVMWSEPGTAFEEEVAELLRGGGFTKPLIAFVAGRFVEDLPEGIVFGHAGSIIEGERGRPSTKLARLREAGAVVADNFNDLGVLVARTLDRVQLASRRE